MTRAGAIQLSASLEDYLEAIFNLADQDENQTARSKDIAETLGVAKPSVTGALRMLAGKGLVNYKPYGQITLTETGRRRARQVVRKHNVLKSFFANILGLDAETSQEAACRAEHILGGDTIARLVRFIEFVSAEEDRGYDLARRFQDYWQKAQKEEGGE